MKKQIVAGIIFGLLSGVAFGEALSLTIPSVSDMNIAAVTMPSTTETDGVLSAINGNLTTLDVNFNKVGGYKITAASANGFTLDSDNNSLAYTINCTEPASDAYINFVQSPALTADGNCIITGSTFTRAETDQSIAVVIDVVQSEVRKALDEAHTDTLTLTLADKI